MCRPTTCRTCGRPTWAGCGRHVEQALAHVPRDQRCPGHPGRNAAGSRARPGLVARLLGRR